MMAFLMKILQIQRIVRHLVQCMSRIFTRANLKFQQKNQTIHDVHRVDAATDARNGILENDMASPKLTQFPLEDTYFFKPRIALQVLEGEWIVSRQLTQNAAFILQQKSLHRACVKSSSHHVTPIGRVGQLIIQKETATRRSATGTRYSLLQSALTRSLNRRFSACLAQSCHVLHILSSSSFPHHATHSFRSCQSHDRSKKSVAAPSVGRYRFSRFRGEKP